MTAPALAWQRFDPGTSTTGCSFDGCTGTPIYMRGPRSPRLRLPWRAYCRAHASLYGVASAGRLSRSMSTVFPR